MISHVFISFSAVQIYDTVFHIFTYTDYISVQQIVAIIPHKGANLELKTSCPETITKVELSQFL